MNLQNIKAVKKLIRVNHPLLKVVSPNFVNDLANNNNVLLTSQEVVNISDTYRGTKPKVKTIDINVKEWFDRVNGNSYFSAQATVNFGMKSQQNFKLPFQYGYGSHSIDMALKHLTEQKIIKTDRQWELRDAGIVVRTSKQENCLKRDVIAFGS